MQGFNRTPWNATSRTTAQDALWQHILYRNTSSQPLMTPCARQVMNRIPGNVTPPWAGCSGPLHSCSMSRAIPAQRNRQPDSGRSTVLTENIRPAVDRRSACGVGVPRVMWCTVYWVELTAVCGYSSRLLQRVYACIFYLNGCGYSWQPTVLQMSMLDTHEVVSDL